MGHDSENGAGNEDGLPLSRESRKVSPGVTAGARRSEGIRETDAGYATISLHTDIDGKTVVAMGTADTLLEIANVDKSFGGLQAVHGCSLRVRRGTITGLIGPNGAGKTTLFNLISGFFAPDAGRIVFQGKRIDGLPPHRVFRHGLCRTFQVPKELKQMTVLENLMLVPAGQAGEVLGAAWLMPWRVRRQEREAYDKALDVLEFVKLAHLRAEYAANLSTGQKKLLELARAMMTDPQLIMLDEPGAGVNPTLLHSLMAQIERLVAERDITVLLIEHNMAVVMGICDPVIVLSNGEKLAEGTPAEIQQNEQVLAAYLGGQNR